MTKKKKKKIKEGLLFHIKESSRLAFSDFTDFNGTLAATGRKLGSCIGSNSDC